VRPFVPFLIRDLALTGLAAALFALDRTMSETLVAVLAGLSAGGVGFLIHEWGHLLGALRAGARVFAPERLASLFLFRFDLGANDRRQFLSMSWGGYLGSILGAVLIVGLASFEVLSHQVAVGAVALGTLATLVLEIPTHVRVSRGGPLPVDGIVYTREA